MKTKITGFHQDEYKQWVADLSCGHSRHFRHDPPFQVREWVTSPQGRNTYNVDKVCLVGFNERYFPPSQTPKSVPEPLQLCHPSIVSVGLFPSQRLKFSTKTIESIC